MAPLELREKSRLENLENHRPHRPTNSSNIIPAGITPVPYVSLVSHLRSGFPSSSGRRGRLVIALLRAAVYLNFILVHIFCNKFILHKMKVEVASAGNVEAQN